MNTEALKISLAQKILSISDNNLLKKLKLLIEQENAVGYDSKGNPIFESQYVKEMDVIFKEIGNKTAKLYLTGDIRKCIIDANNLAQ